MSELPSDAVLATLFDLCRACFIEANCHGAYAFHMLADSTPPGTYLIASCPYPMTLSSSSSPSGTLSFKLKMLARVLVLAALPYALAAKSWQTGSSFAGSTSTAAFPPQITDSAEASLFPDASEVGFASPTPSTYMLCSIHLRADTLLQLEMSQRLLQLPRSRLRRRTPIP